MLRPVVFLSLLCLAACDSRALPLAVDGGGPDESPAPGVDGAPGAQACPAAEPALAAACPVGGQVCPYQRGSCLTVYRCEDGHWLEIVGCSHAAGCPKAPPAEGSACPASLLGLDCFYPGEPCSESSIVQCDGAVWRAVNGCPGRTSQIHCTLREVLDPGEQLAFELSGKQLDHPALALAGTQLLVAFRASAGVDGSHAVYARRLETARPEPVPVVTPAASDRVGRDAVSGPALGFVRDRFTLAWAANDGWPGATNHQPGTFVRGLPLGALPLADVLVDAAGSGVSALAVRPGAGWLASRFPVTGKSSSGYAVALTGLGPANEAIASSRTVVADEAAELPWFATPVPVAMARVVPWRAGFAAAVPVPASGDFSDDSGIALHLIADTAPRFEPSSTVRLDVGFPTRLSIAALEDDSVVVAYRGQWDGAPPGGAQFRMERVAADGTRTKVSTIQTYVGDPLGAGPVVVPFDRQGYVVGWTTVASGASSGTLHLQIYSAKNTRGNHYTQVVPGLRPTGQLALAYAETDRSLHVAFSAQDTTGWSRVYRNRLICGARD